MVKCLSDAAAKWDKRLNEAYRETLKEGPKEQQAQLRKAQRFWVQFRDANCDYYGLSEGSIAHVLGRDLPSGHDQGAGEGARGGAGELSRPPFRRGRRPVTRD